MTAELLPCQEKMFESRKSKVLTFEALPTSRFVQARCRQRPGTKEILSLAESFDLKASQEQMDSGMRSHILRYCAKHCERAKEGRNKVMGTATTTNGKEN